MTYQDLVANWCIACFGPTVFGDKEERVHRFVEESLELAQAAGCSKEEVLQLVDYVYSRPIGELGQEVGGVCVTLNAMVEVFGLDVEREAVKELQRCHQNIDKIRAKQATKPKFSPLPQ